MIIRLGKLGADTIYFTFLGRPTGIAFSLLPTILSTVFIKPSSPHGLPVLVLLLIVLFIPRPQPKGLFYAYKRFEPARKATDKGCHGTFLFISS